LLPFEGLRELITTVIFDGKNYNLRERAVPTTLKAKNKLGFIDRILIRPAEKEDEEFFEAKAWDMVNYMFCSWILNIRATVTETREPLTGPTLPLVIFSLVLLAFVSHGGVPGNPSRDSLFLFISVFFYCF